MGNKLRVEGRTTQPGRFEQHFKVVEFSAAKGHAQFAQALFRVHKLRSRSRGVGVCASNDQYASCVTRMGQVGDDAVAV